MPQFGADDLATFFADGVTVQYGGASAMGNLSVEDDLVDFSSQLKSGAMEQKLQVELPADALPGLKAGVDVTVDGTSYRVRDFRRIGDGLIVRILLSKAL